MTSATSPESRPEPGLPLRVARPTVADETERPALYEPVAAPQLSVVIPVYNSADSLASLVDQICATFSGMSFEVLLVNDGSRDDSDKLCDALAEKYPDVVGAVHLARNFGEHNAVLAGLSQAAGQYVAVLDDDGQNPPHEVLRMLQYAKANDLDVVYGRYYQRKHSWFRAFGSWVNDKVANVALRKPREIYLSSFKVMNRFLVDEVVRFTGPFPYIDGLIFRATRRVGQLEVIHRARQSGSSGYTLVKLVALMANMFLGSSIIPLRASLLTGLTAAVISVFVLAGTVLDKLWLNPQVTVGIPTVLACIAFFGGVQLVVLGAVGEYVGRLFLQQHGLPQYIIRSQTRFATRHAVAGGDVACQPALPPRRVQGCE